MACPPIEPFTIPATHTVPVFASELTGSRVTRYVPCTRARTMINTLRQQVTTASPDTPPVCGEGSKVPSLDKASRPGIAVVQDSLGLDYCSRIASRSVYAGIDPVAKKKHDLFETAGVITMVVSEYGTFLGVVGLMVPGSRPYSSMASSDPC